MGTEDCGLEIAKAAAEAAAKESVNKIANVIGGAFPFWGLKRQAVETYIDEIKNSNLSPEMKMMAIADAKKNFKQLQRQATVAQIAQDIAQEGTDFSETSKVDDEWLERFMDAVKFVSDEDMQVMWGNILAKEFENPGSTPASVIRIMTEISPKNAKMFEQLCGMGVYLFPENEQGGIVGVQHEYIIPLGTKGKFLESQGITLSTLNELEAVGLVKYDALAGYIKKWRYPRVHILHGKEILSVSEYSEDAFPMGNVMLTSAGESIARFTTGIKNAEMLEVIKEYMVTEGAKFSETPLVKITEVGEALFDIKKL